MHKTNFNPQLLILQTLIQKFRAPIPRIMALTYILDTRTQLGLGVNNYDHQYFPEQDMLDLLAKVAHNSPFNPHTLNTYGKYFVSSFVNHCNIYNLRMLASPTIQSAIINLLVTYRMIEHRLIKLPYNIPLAPPECMIIRSFGFALLLVIFHTKYLN